MPTYDFKCAACKGVATLCVQRCAQPLCAVCGAVLQRIPCTQSSFFIPDRDKAVNSGDNAKYRDWLNSPETQAKIRSGELQRETSIKRSSNSLTDHVECMDLDSYHPQALAGGGNGE